MSQFSMIWKILPGKRPYSLILIYFYFRKYSSLRGRVFRFVQNWDTLFLVVFIRHQEGLWYSGYVVILDDLRGGGPDPWFQRGFLLGVFVTLALEVCLYCLRSLWMS